MKSDSDLIYRSPLHDAIDPLNPRYGVLNGMPVPLGFQDAAREQEQAQRLGLCDASALARTTLKGLAVAAFLRTQSPNVPERIYQVVPTADLGLIARTGAAEYFLEDGPAGKNVLRIAEASTTTPGVYRALRQDASIMLSGAGAVDVLRQTCAYRFEAATEGSALVMTRVAGVSCAILSRTLNAIPLFQFWLDGTYGDYLWETLLEIAGDSAGNVVGLQCFFPELGSGVEPQ